jgi:triacylglycerol lipase
MIYWNSKFRFNALATVILCTVSLAACAGISRTELQKLGSEVSSTPVDFAELRAFAERSRAAYGTEAAIKSKFKKTVRIKAVGETDVLYFLERDDKARTQIITVRGTANNANMLEDLDFTVSQDLGAEIPVHAGFDLVARAVYNDVSPYLRQGYRTNLTGHSLGGAVAALVTIYAIKGGHRVERVVTFGQPRFTTAAGVSRLSYLPLIRVVDENDMVSMLPPATVLHSIYGPYEHVGPEVILLEGSRYSYLTSHIANRLAIGEFLRSAGIANLPDHKIDNYIARITTKLKGALPVAYNQREQYVALPN